MHSHKITVLIPTYNRPDDIESCLKLIEEQTYRNFEVVIADASNNTQTEEIAKAFCDDMEIHWVKCEKGLVAQRALGLQVATGDIICSTADDIRPPPNWLEELVKIYSMRDDIAGVTGPTLIPENRLSRRDLFKYASRFEDGLWWKILGAFYNTVVLDGRQNEPCAISKCGAMTLESSRRSCLRFKTAFEVDCLDGTNMSLKADLLRRAGGMDTGFFGDGTWSEPDICLRVRGLGYRFMFNPRAAVYHYVSKAGDFRNRAKNMQFTTRNYFRFYSRHFGFGGIDKALRFSIYLAFMNGYCVYKAASTGSLLWLYGILGTLLGIRDVIGHERL